MSINRVYEGGESSLLATMIFMLGEKLRADIASQSEMFDETDVALTGLTLAILCGVVDRPSWVKLEFAKMITTFAENKSMFQDPEDN